jgi:pyrimidine operon attenuation protein/uracil phosphoribosyltransferase
MSAKRTILLTHDEIQRKIERMAWEIYETNHLTQELVIIGLSDNGTYIANLIAKHLQQISKINIISGRIDLDKTKGFDAEVALKCNANLLNKSVILVDDVLNSGKTMLTSMLPIVAQKPIKIQTAILANRSHKAFPVNADIVGISLATTLQEHIWFELEPDGKMLVFLT